MAPIRRQLLKTLELLGIDLDDSRIMLGVPEAKAPYFKKAVTALRSLKQGVRSSAILAETGLVRQQVSYLVKRLTVTGIDGKPLALRALIEGAQKKRCYSPDVVHKGKPAPGALTTLLISHPDICRALTDLTLLGVHPEFETPLERGLVTDDLVHQLLVTLCAAKGIKAPDYPFCGDQEGKRSLSNWMKFIRALQVQEEHLAGMKAMPEETEMRRRIRRAYARVEADAHSIAVKWNLRCPSLRGEGFVDIKVNRLWLIALQECASGAILGRSFGFGSNYSGSDFMRAVNHALVPWKRLGGHEHRYQLKDGMPTGEPDLQWRVWNVLAVDSAMAHTCSIALTTLARTVNCVLEVGPVGEPDVRANIEGAFSELQELFRLLPGFLEKPHERDPQSGRTIIHFDLLVAAIDLLIARYNGSVSPGTSMTRLELLKHAIGREATIVRKVPVALRELCERFDTFDTKFIGKDKRGHAVVRWASATYEGIGLASAPNLIGKEVLLAADSQDPRRIRAWLLDDGRDLGMLDIEPRYRSSAASVTTRQHIKRSQHADSFLRNAMNLPLAFRQLVEERSHKRSSDYQELARLVIEQVFAKDAGELNVRQPSPATQIAQANKPPEPDLPPPDGRPVASVIPLPTAPAPIKHVSEVAQAARAITSI